MEAKLILAMDNAAFEDDPGEPARILRELGDKIQDGVAAGDRFTAMDVNGC